MTSRTVVAMWMVLAGCSAGGAKQGASQPTQPTRPEPEPQERRAEGRKRVPESLREVDWGNGSYDLEGPGKVTLLNGRNELHEYMEGEGTYHTTDIWSLQAIGYGDVDGDGNEEAVLAFSYESYGRNYQWSNLFVQIFAWRNGRAKMIQRSAAPAGVVTEVKVTGDEIVLVRDPSVPPPVQRLRIVDGELRLLDAPPGGW